MEAIELKSQSPMLEAVGRGIQAFATVEAGVGVVFASLMEPADRYSSILVLDAARNIETKLKITQAVLEHRLADDQRARGVNLLNRVRKRGDVRNKLAHWAVTHWPMAATAAEVKEQIVVLAPPLWSKDHFPVMMDPKSTDVSPLRITEIEDFARLCQRLFSDLAAFSNEEMPFKNDATET